MMACVSADALTPSLSIELSTSSAAATSPTRACAETTVLYAIASGASPAARIRSSQCAACSGSPARPCACTIAEYDFSSGCAERKKGRRRRSMPREGRRAPLTNGRTARRGCSAKLSQFGSALVESHGHGWSLSRQPTVKPRLTRRSKAARACTGCLARAHAAISVLYETRSGAAFGFSSTERLSKLRISSRAPAASAALAYALSTVLNARVSGFAVLVCSIRVRYRRASSGRAAAAKPEMTAVYVICDGSCRPASSICSSRRK
eukprot:4384041-Prymnesium_polylepis.3